MADDINLPNLISHLQVNLGDTSGIVADATRQGSSVGSAIGESMQRTLRAAVDDLPDIEIDGDSTDLDRDLARVRQELDQLANQRIGVDISLEDALAQMERLEPHLERLQRYHPNVLVQASVGGALADLADLRDAARLVDDTDVDIDVDIDDRGLNRRLERVRGALGRVAGAAAGLGAIAAMGAKAGAAVGALVPIVAGLVTTLANIAPAAAVGLSAVVALQLATNTFKLAMSGVGDAVKAALDPSDPEAYAEALKKLSPNARAFVQEIHKASPALAAIKKSVQDKVFAGLDKQLAATAKTTLPVFRRALDSTAGTLNRMGKGVFTAVRNLGTDGTLGIALKGATSGLREFSRAPGQVVTALGQISAAAGPTFARLSKAGGGALDRLAAKLSKSFESGGMERAIEQAITLIGQLGRVIGNVGSILGSVFGAAQSQGGGFLGVLESVTAEISRIAKTDAVQDALKSLFGVMQTLGSTVAPLLGQALQAIAPVFTSLGPPVTMLIKTLGGALAPIITALGPVLLGAADAVGSLVVACAPLLTLAGELVAGALPSLTPLLEGLSDIFIAMAPFIAQVAEILQSILAPALSALPVLLQGIITPFVQLAQDSFPQLADMLERMAPQFADLGVKLGELLVALGPLALEFGSLITVIASDLIPLIGPPLIGALALIAVGLGAVATVITNVVIPAIRVFIDLLQGDFFNGNEAAKKNVQDFANRVAGFFLAMNTSVTDSLRKYGAQVKNTVAESSQGFRANVSKMVSDVVGYFRGLPDRIRGAVGNLRGLLSSAGASIVSGLIDGIQSKIPSVKGVLGGLTDMIPDWKGPKKKDAKLLTPAGRSIIKGLIDGIEGSTAALKSKLTSITNLIERAISINSGNKKKVSGLGSLLKRVASDNKRLLALAKQRDSVAAKLKAAQTKLSDAIKTRADAAAQIRAGIVGDANITSGNSVVNSVSAITIGLQQAAAKAKTFAANLLKLRKAGLRTDLLDDIASAGMDGGAATAAALAKATPAELKRINDLQKQLVTAAGTSGNAVAGAMYDAGVKAAQGLVAGLKKQQSAIEKTMEKIGAALLKALRKVLDIHSPSRRARQIGRLFMEGMPLGFEDMRAVVSRSAASVANAAANAASAVASVTPSIPLPGQLSTAYAGAGAAGATTNNFYLQGGDATPDGILRALSWQGLIGRRGR
ncbi:hypothetical protein [Streptomyces sp. NPDC048332]|uniref:hypothetical protein n=1 Tax=Streptomyces sp. NPDC048332 TaxID=3154619 RepID=UPI00341DFEC3